jgi:tetratricopeptide (TPR) repeat protein
VRSLLVAAAAMWVLSVQPASAQKAVFVRALAEFHATVSGHDGDEGMRISSDLDALSSALAGWDAWIAESEGTLLPQTQAATPAAAADAHIALGSMYLQRLRLDDALRHFDAAAGRAPTRARPLLLRGRALKSAGQPDEAAVAFRQAWEREPESTLAAYQFLTHNGDAPPELVAQARAALAAGRRALLRGTRDARPAPFVVVGALGDVAGSAPAVPPALYASGFAAILEGRYEDGIEQLREAAARDPLIVDDHLRSEEAAGGIRLLQSGALDAAIASLQTVARGAANSSEVHRILGRAFWLKGALTESLEHLELAVMLRPDDERSRMTLARSLAEAGDLERAGQVLREGLVVAPEATQFHLDLADLSQQLQRSDLAVHHYEEAATRPVPWGLGQLYARLVPLAFNRLDLTVLIDAAERWAAVEPNNPVAHRTLATAYLQVGRHDEALVELDVALWMNPDDADTLTAIAQVQLGRQQPAEALELLRRAVQVRPDAAEPRYAIARALMQLGRVEEAHQETASFAPLRDEILERNRRDTEIVTLLREADLEAAAGRHDDAARLLADVVSLAPDVLSYRLRHADALVEAGRLEESLDHLIRAGELDGVAEVHRRAATVLSLLGRHEEAAQAQAVYQRLRWQDLTGRRPD